MVQYRLTNFVVLWRHQRNKIFWNAY